MTSTDGDPFNAEHASQHQHTVPMFQRRYLVPEMSEEQYYDEVQSENRTRRLTCDPLEGHMWIVQVSLGRFSEDRPYLEVKGSLTQHYVTPEESMDQSGYPCHIMIPSGSTLLMERMIRRARYEATIQLCKMDNTPSGDHATTYRVVGGSVMGFLNVLQQCGFEPPVGKTETRAGAPWHISM